ncbi:cob(I)yrinic acid a,c-diamide adenosyltransferase [Shimwellia blattae]|uniref:Corrinoid adenosyltransferase n=2 Tax=Shimwellia blattae TaxID=563 RepID=I2BC38_SHIBC|nr:cob(I)yrinic acid a,c-diamide adenosyltransferase [Shimwellia blattae]AAX12913.1 putative adenosyl transferase subunit [Shimwellia blattae DSM 4481 = NBRC 105725]AFJ48092.1 putative B12 related propanediol dehydrogenase protein [Shimwellia blattae DSM 4481 = NBRC 105725]VDY65590.1 Cob(I)yrinic acid a,c-diamide adenosyltransferase [Shimwellia blattae]VEC25038.1 Cob(I)yrinic acid a,c-diamide adenosyltransferase [Shimwellia blattae]GAB81920.1 putative adenosyl transferase subunit [Shimwellia b
MYRIYTRTGDAGSTALFGGSRIHKDDIRVEAYGQVDTLISLLGVCYATSYNPALRETLRRIQEELFVVGAELASDPRGLTRLDRLIGQEDITRLEQEIDHNMAATGPLKAFVIPGKNLASAQLHVARTQTRQIERILVAMDNTTPLRAPLKSYINRLSDALFAMARVEECPPEEQATTPGGDA